MRSSRYPRQASPLTICRIWEKLCEEGWREEIATHKSEYEPGLMKIKGVTMIRPLGKKGVRIPSYWFSMA